MGKCLCKSLIIPNSYKRNGGGSTQLGSLASETHRSADGHNQVEKAEKGFLKLSGKVIGVRKYRDAPKC